MRQEPSAGPATRRHRAPRALFVAIVLWFSLTASAPAGPFRQAAAATDPYAEAVLADQPAVYLRLDEAAGPFALDSSGHGEDGTYQSGVAYGTSGAVLTDPGHTAITWTGGGNGPVTAVTQSGTTLPVGNAART